MSETIRGFVEYVFFPKSGLDKQKNLQFAGFTIRSENKTVRCFGMTPFVSIGDYFEFTGVWENKNTFKFESCMRVDDDAMGATSMLIFVFGPKTARKVINHFEDEPMKAWDIFKFHEDKFKDEMKKVKGIGNKKVEKAYDKYANHVTVDVIFNKFSKYGLMLNKALTIYEEWGNNALKIIDENPYKLIYLDKIPFQVMDKIACGFYHIPKTDERRIYAGVLYCMKAINKQGHTFMRLNEKVHNNESFLLEEAENVLHVDRALIREEIFNLVDDKKLVMDKYGFSDIVYLPKVYRAETSIAAMVKEFISVTTIRGDIVDAMIDEYETLHKLCLADKQKDAIKMSVGNRFSIISGPPGSGKTTIIDCICSILTKVNKNCQIKLAAPTGKAAKRMTESTGRQAETIHRMLRYSPVTNEFTFNKLNPLHADVIIVDECSMMSNMLAYQLFSAIPNNCMVILVGDKNQLPSIDAGKVLEDLLDVYYIPKVILNQVYRQDKNSTILQRALDISLGKIPDLEDGQDFIFWEESNVNDLQEGVLNLYYDECAKYGVENVLFLTPLNKYELGVDTLNKIIQENCNPLLPGEEEIKSGKRYFRRGDRVIQLTNEEEYGVFNGMVGSIVKIVKEEKELGIKDTITVDYGDIQCEYERERFDNIKHAYAMTIHKCQGSEAASVIMICHSSHKFMMRKKLIYTAMTRAKKQLQIVGEKGMIIHSLRVEEPIRNTKLKKFLGI